MSANSSSENSQPNENNSSFEQHYISHWRKEKLHEADKSEILQALKTFKKRLNDFVLAGCDEYLAGNYERAIDYCTIALSASPVLADAYLYRGSAYFRLEEFKKATQDIWEYINIVQEDENVYQKLGRIYCNWGTSLCIAGKVTEALPKLSQAIQINPRNIEAYAVRAHALREQGQYLEALKDYYRALKIIPNDAYLLYARGLIFMDLARYRFAIRDFEKSLSIDPDFPKARKAMDEALSKIGTGAKPDFMVAAEILIGRDPNCDWVFHRQPRLQDPRPDLPAGK